MAKKSLNISDFDQKQTLGIGTFGKVKLVFFRGARKKFPFALKILQKTEIIKLN